MILLGGPLSTDKVIKIMNKGFLIANMKVSYELQVDANKVPVVQSGSIVIGQAFAFYVPASVNYDGDVGVTLKIDIPLSFKQISFRLQTSPQCFHIWGIVFSPEFSPVNCW